MRTLLLLAAAAACGSSSKPAESTTTVTTTQDPAQAATGSGAPPVTALQPQPPAPPPPPPSPPRSPPAAQPTKPLYSCFSYIAVNTTAKRYDCMRTRDCPDLVEQAKAIKGIRELSGCASVPAVWCFHQLVKGDPEGADVCQPTAADCSASRAAAVKAKESVDSDCAQR